MRETNIQRILKQAEEGTSLADLTEIDRNDLQSLANIDLAAYDRNNWSDDQPVYGSLTLGELRRAQKLSKTLTHSKTLTEHY